MEERSRYDCSGKWFKGNMHMHTTNSDGGLTPRQAAEFYAERGYDFMCITDHMVPFVGANEGDELPIATLDGIELHGEDDQGSFYHAVCIGNVAGISKDMSFSDALAKARSEGSFLIWAHPHWSGNTVAEGMRHGFHGLEIYNSGSQLAYGKGMGMFHWDECLRHGADMLGFATDDSHFIEAAPLEGAGWITVNAPELSAEVLMASIRQGNFYSSSGPEFKNIYIEKGNRVVADTSPILHARLVGPRWENKYKGMVGRGLMEHTHFRIPDEWAFARLEIADENGNTAWSNPLVKPA
jgi:hypothetical protein